MANVTQILSLEDAVLPTTNPAQLQTIQGSNFPIKALSFDADTEESAYFPILPVQYVAAGTLGVELYWYPATASSGVVTWGIQLAAITPDVDTQNITTDLVAAADVVNDTCLGANRVHVMNFGLLGSGLDSLADGDWAMLRVYRDADAAADTMTGDAHLIGVKVVYSDI